MRGVVLALVVSSLAIVLTSCADREGSQAVDARLGNTFEATADRPYSFRYPSAWTVGDEAEGDLAIGVEDSVGVVLEPVHPWSGTGAFTQGSERVEVDGYEAYRMPLDGGEQGKGLAYRVNANGVNVTVWFFANDPAAYDESLFEAIMETFRVDRELLTSS